MSDVIFMLRNPEPPAPEKCASGSTPLEQAVLEAFVRIVVEGLDADERMFMMAILWAPAPGKSRTTDDTCSRLQRIGLVKQTIGRSFCVPTKLTPLGHSVRQYIFDLLRSAIP